MSVDSLSTSVARIKVSLDSHVLMMLMHATGGHGELNLIPLASTMSYQDVGAETVSFAACPTPAQLPHGLQFAAAVDLPGIVAGYPPPSVTAAAQTPSIIGVRGVAEYNSSVEDQERQPSSTSVERPQLLDVDYAAELSLIHI